MHTTTLLDRALRVLIEAYQRDLTGRSPSGPEGGSPESDREGMRCATHGRDLLEVDSTEAPGYYVCVVPGCQVTVIAA